MVSACPKPRCFPSLGDDFLVKISGSPFSPIDQSGDCSTGLLFLTDDAGFFDTEDQPMGAWLDVDNRFKTLSTIEDLARHYLPCSPTYKDIFNSFFLKPFGTGSRSSTITVGYVDDLNETLLEGYQAVTVCDPCAWTVTHVLLKVDGVTPFYDTAELRDLDLFITAENERKFFANTAESDLYFSDPFETTSSAAQAAALGSRSAYVDMSVRCDVERDIDCVPIEPEVIVTEYNNSALNAAAIYSSYSAQGSVYNFSGFLKPKNFDSVGSESGIFIDPATFGTTNDVIFYGISEVANHTGVNANIPPPQPNFVEGATRYVNAFFNQKRGIMFAEGLEVSGNYFIDTWYKEKAFKERLRDVTIGYMSSQDALGGLSDDQTGELVGKLYSDAIKPFIDNGVIQNSVKINWEAKGYTNIYLPGTGWVITRTPLSDVSQAALQQRNGYALGVCFVPNEPQHRVGISLCEIPTLV